LAKPKEKSISPRRTFDDIATDIMLLQSDMRMAGDEETEKYLQVQLEERFTELAEKEDGVYWYFQSNQKMVEMMDDQIKKLTRAKKTLSNKQEFIKGLVLRHFEATGTTPSHSEFNPITVRDGRAAVNITDESKLPREYMNMVQSFKPDKRRILEALKEDKEIAGVELVYRPFVHGLKPAPGE
jgi:hypothetical protein